MLTVRAIKPFHGPDGRIVRPGELVSVSRLRAAELVATRRADAHPTDHPERVRPPRRAQTGPTHTTAGEPRYRG